MGTPLQVGFWQTMSCQFPAQSIDLTEYLSLNVNVYSLCSNYIMMVVLSANTCVLSSSEVLHFDSGSHGLQQRNQW